MRLEVAVQSVSRDAARRDPLEVFAWSVPSDAAVGSSREWCLVYDRVAAGGLNALIAAPLLRKDMVNVDALVEVILYGRLFARHPVASAFAQQERVYAFVCGTVSSAQRYQPGGSKFRIIDGARLRPTVPYPAEDLREIAAEARLDGAPVELSEHAAPVPPRNLLSRKVRLPIAA